MAKKRLLLIIPNLGTGGAQKVFREQMKYLSLTYEVYGCVFNWDGALPTDRTHHMHSLEVPAGKNVILKIYCFLQRVVRLSRLKRALKIDVSVSHLEGADYVNLLSRIGEKIICWIHGTKKFDENIEGKLGWLRKSWLIPFTYRRASGLVAVSNGIRQEMMTVFGIPEEKIHTIYNGFDIGLIQKLSEEKLENHVDDLFREHVIITHCRLARQKNLPGLIRLFKSMREKIDMKLVILGDGELRTLVLTECVSAGLVTYDVWSGHRFKPDCDVFLLGYTENPFKYLRKASLYVMSSGWEGFPLALCEAMACGLPVVSTDCYTGPREILAPSLDAPVEAVTKGEFGLLLPLLNPSSEERIRYCGEELSKLVVDAELMKQYSQLARRRVEAFSHDRTREAVTSLLQSLNR